MSIPTTLTLNDLSILISSGFVFTFVTEHEKNMGCNIILTID